MNLIPGRNPAIDAAKTQLVTQMLENDVDSEEYKQAFDYLNKLAVIEAANARSRVSPDTMAVVAANLLGILIIVGYEHGHVIGTRALSFLRIPTLK